MFFVLALILVFLPGSYRQTLAHGIRATILRPVLELQAGAVERRARFDDPDRLRAQRDSLAAFLVGQVSLASENDELRALLGLRERMPPSFIPAEVVRIPGRGSEGYFQLTAGAADGVHAGAPIVTADGLVGRVLRIDNGIAFGIDWTQQQFRASAMTLDGSVYGLIEPRISASGEPMLALTGTPRHVELPRGTLIVTSGHGGVFPRGIPVGTVASVEGTETSWQRNYLLEPSVNPGEMNYVLVLGAPQETMNGADLTAVWGIEPPPPPDTAAATSFGARATSSASEAPATAGGRASPPPAPTVTQPALRPPALLGVPIEPSVSPDTGQ